jgi:putative ABC transport system ATP-binding protein
MPLVEIERLTKTYAKGSQTVPVLRDLDLTVEAGEFLALMGPSGSGKTTLLNLIAGIDRPTSGAIRVGGQDLAKLSRNRLAAWRAEHVGYVFQLYNLIPVLTAYENVELPLLLLPLSRSERRKRVQVALDAVGLLDRYDHYPRQLSGGQEQRVAIARAIVADPTILVADEPTGDLDADTAAATLTLLRRLSDEMGKTLVMVTHDPKAAGVARRLVRLEKGRLVDDVVPLVPHNGHSPRHRAAVGE